MLRTTFLLKSSLQRFPRPQRRIAEACLPLRGMVTEMQYSSSGLNNLYGHEHHQDHHQHFPLMMNVFEIKRHFSTAGSTRSTTNDSSQSATAASLYMWGTDNQGCLMKPKDRLDEKVLYVPQIVDDLSWLNVSGMDDADGDDQRKSDQNGISEVICGPTSTAILKKDGECYVMGDNQQGQLGVGHQNAVNGPTRVQLPIYEDDVDSNKPARKIAQVSLGANFSAFVDNMGDLYTTGFNGSTFSGASGLGHGFDIEDANVITPHLVHTMIEDNCYVKQVSVSESHATILTTEGEVLCCGSGSYGRLGNGSTNDQFYFEPVEGLDKEIVQIAGGKSFTFALTKEGVLYGWGRNHKYQLGNSCGFEVDMYAMQSIPDPLDVGELTGQLVTQISAGNAHAACITERGELFYWGMNEFMEPEKVHGLLHTEIVQVACGFDYTLALDKDGILYSFGDGKSGVLGHGSTLKKARRPQRMEIFDQNGDNEYSNSVLQISAGYKHAACLVQQQKSNNVLNVVRY